MRVKTIFNLSKLMLKMKKTSIFFLHLQKANIQKFLKFNSLKVVTLLKDFHIIYCKKRYDFGFAFYIFIEKFEFKITIKM